MGWKDMAKLAGQWADAKKTELLTADGRTRENASAEADAVERRSQEEAVTSFLEAALPQNLADKVTAARPENVAARKAAKEARERAERREQLAAMAESGATAELTLTISGDEHGTASVTLPFERREEHGWLYVHLESADLLPVGSIGLAELALAVPEFRGPGRYDLAELAERGDAGEIDSFDALEMYLNPTGEADDRILYVDVYGDAPVIEVGPGSLSFDLPMVSAVSSIRATGTITW
jgi:DNA-binding phage protein